MDPETEAAPLATILRGDGPLDPDGLELLARLVTGDLRKVRPRAGETVLVHAVRRAGTAWRAGKDADPATTGAALAAALRGDAACLGAGKRALLADLVTGDMRREWEKRKEQDNKEKQKEQNTSIKGVGHPKVLAIVQFYRARESKAMRRRANEQSVAEYLTSRSRRMSARKQKHKSVFSPAEYLARSDKWSRRDECIKTTAEKFGIKPRTLENYLAMVEEREDWIQAASAEHRHVHAALRVYKKLLRRYDADVAASLTAEWNNSHYSWQISATVVPYYMKITEQRQSAIRLKVMEERERTTDI